MVLLHTGSYSPSISFQPTSLPLTRLAGFYPANVDILKNFTRNRYTNAIFSLTTGFLLLCMPVERHPMLGLQYSTEIPPLEAASHSRYDRESLSVTTTQMVELLLDYIKLGFEARSVLAHILTWQPYFLLIHTDLSCPKSG